MTETNINIFGYGSIIQRESRRIPVVSNETILKNRQEFFFAKVAPAQSITNIVLLGS